MTVPPLKCPDHKKYRGKSVPKADCDRCQVMWQENQIKSMWSDYVKSVGVMHNLSEPVKGVK